MKILCSISSVKRENQQSIEEEGFFIENHNFVEWILITILMEKVINFGNTESRDCVKCPNSDFFWYAFSRIWTEYGS